MLHEILEESRQYSAIYGHGLANHLPMALLALHRLGASDERLREFASFYAQRLRPKDAREAALVRQVEDNPRDQIRRLTPGLATAAFHGLIRTAYAIDCGDDVDLPDAVASWMLPYAELGGAEGEPRFDGAAEAFEAMRSDQRLPRTFSGNLIMGAMKSAVAHPAFADYRRPIPNLTLDDLARVAVSIYLATGDFTALHLVTACHATRVLRPWLDESALQHLAIAMLAGYAALGRPAVDRPLVNDAPEWDELSSRAILSNDDHDLKLVYSAREEDAHYGWGLHRKAAALRLSPDPTSSPP